MKKYYYAVLMLFLTTQIQAQKLTQEDYQRAVSFRSENLNNQIVYNLYTQVYWFEDESGLWFIDHDQNGKTYKALYFKDYKVQPLFDQDRLAQKLSLIEEKDLESGKLSLSNIERTKDGHLRFNFESKSYTLHLKTYELQLAEKEDKDEEDPFESKSPDGNWIAFSKDYNLYIKSTDTGQEYQLSHNGEKENEYATYYGWYDIMEGENAERPKHFRVNWSKDSKYIAANVVDFRNAEKMYLLDHSIDSLYKSKLLSYYRGSPGDTTMVLVKPVFFNVESKTEVKTDLPTGTHINSVAVQWMERSGQFLASYAERGFQKEFLKLIDLKNNTEKTLIAETSTTNIDNFWFKKLEGKQKVIFLSERSGWRQLYLVDIETTETIPLTQGTYYINSVVHVSEDKEEIFFLASGKDSKMNPYHQQLYKVDFKGNTTLLTAENAHHVVSFSKDGKYFVDNYSTVNRPTKTVLRLAKSGKITAELTSADVSEVVAKDWQAPEPFQLTAKDGKTTIYGAIWKPTNFNPNKSYPIVDHTYTGPHTQMFPKSFDRAFMNQSLAELGFIVMMVDGLGTSGRSKEFHNHSYKNMGNNLEDHVLAITHLGEKYPWIDTDRVGIFGHSAGGFDTGRAMLAFPEVYKVGVASSADHDFRMEKAWWPEMYQGWPVDSTYHEVSNITNAKNLKGKLLLVHGGIDENVNPSATFKLAEALVNADKDFDLLIFPSQRHGYQGKASKYFTKKRWNYFVEHLKGEVPIWDFKWE